MLWRSLTSDEIVARRESQATAKENPKALGDHAARVLKSQWRYIFTLNDVQLCRTLYKYTYFVYCR